MSGVKKVYVLVNGKENIPGKRMVLSPRAFRTWDSVLRHMSATLGINVKRVYDLHTEQEIDRYAGLAGLEDGWRYVVVNAGERFRPGFQYLFPDGPVKPLANGDDILARKNSIGPHVPQVVRRLGVQTAKPSGNTRLFSHQSKGLRVFLFANGDEKNPPMPVVLNIRNCQSFNHILETVTVTLQFPSYVRRLYNASTSLRVNSLKELQDGMSLVGVAQGAFKIVPYRIPETSENNAEDDGEGGGLSNAVQICVFLPNGVAFHSGTRATVSRGRFDDINKLLAHLAQHLKLNYGQPRRIYALPSGRRIHSIQQLLDSGCTHYSVATTDEPFIECEYLNSRELKPPTASANYANPRAQSTSWFIEGETEDRSRSAPSNLQRAQNKKMEQEQRADMEPVVKPKTKGPSKPVKSFMETLEMSKKLLDRQRDLQVGPSDEENDRHMESEKHGANGILLPPKRTPQPDEEPSESQLDMFIEASKSSKAASVRKRVSFDDDRDVDHSASAPRSPLLQSPPKEEESNEIDAEAFDNREEPKNHEEVGEDGDL